MDYYYEYSIYNSHNPYSVPVQFMCLQIINATFPEVWELERFQTAKVTFKVIQGHQ